MTISSLGCGWKRRDESQRVQTLHESTSSGSADECWIEMGHGRFRRTIDVAAERQLSICADAEMLKKRRGGSGRLARGAGNGQEPRSIPLPDSQRFEWDCPTGRHACMILLFRVRLFPCQLHLESRGVCCGERYRVQYGQAALC